MTRYTPIPTTVIQSENLNEKQFHTYCLIMEKCWNPETNAFEWSDVYSMSSFARELGKPRTTILDHLKQLIDINLVQIHYFSDIAFSVIPTATDGQPTEVSASRPIIINTTSFQEGILSEELKEKDDGQPTGVGQPTVAVEIVEILKNAGVADPMRTKIATSGISAADVKTWLNCGRRRAPAQPRYCGHKRRSAGAGALPRLHRMEWRASLCRR